MNKISLCGAGILVTRPRQTSAEQVAAIQKNGGVAIEFPVIEINAHDEARVEQAIAALPAPQIAIYVSRNAAQFGARFVDSEVVAAIGPATAAALESVGKGADVCPANGFDSEALLAEPAMADVAGKVIWVVRGNAGREQLARTLRDRGAEVHYVPVYDRKKPPIDTQAATQLETLWNNGKIQATIAMSVDSLNNLIALLPQSCSAQLGDLPLVTPAVRVIKELLNHYPNARPVLAKGPSVGPMLEAVHSAIQITRTDS